jgi:hypothetical protein
MARKYPTPRIRSIAASTKTGGSWNYFRCICEAMGVCSSAIASTRLDDFDCHTSLSSVLLGNPGESIIEHPFFSWRSSTLSRQEKSATREQEHRNKELSAWG